MNHPTGHRIFFKLLVLTFLSLSLWTLAGRTGNSQQAEKYIPVQIIHPLGSENGVVPVELQCGTAHLTAPNQLAGFDCKLRNQTKRGVTAANVIYSVILEQNGTLVRETSNSFIETLSEPEFRGANKSIAPGEESPIGPAGPQVYPDSIIKGIEIGIDYVEFDDKTALGPNERGSQIISEVREGAIKYKNWLARKYNQNGKSVDKIAALLRNDQPLPTELGLLTPNQELGVKSYRSRLLSLYQNRGGSEVERLLSERKSDG